MTDLFKGAERLMAMSDDVWLRHANPLSGWTRLLLSLPFLSLAIWSHVWLGWGAFVPVAVALFWIWWNPRAFRAPERFDSWMSHAVLGEYVFLHRSSGVAGHHVRAAKILGAMSAPGALIWILGLWWHALDWVIFGMVLTALPKIWFCDRMVWIYRDFRRAGGSVLGVFRDGLGTDNNDL